jgi:hypothetical protein
MTDTPDALRSLVNAKLDEERIGREARRTQWAVVQDGLGWLPTDGQIYVERNELQLDDYPSSQGRHSYLEQVKLHEVGPGEGQAIVDALLLLPGLLKHLTRDMMTDEERVAVGWRDVPAEAIAAWNTRADTTQAARIAALEAEVGRKDAALKASEAAIAEYYRYWTGGETRGSYDGKPERNGLWRALQTTRAALTEPAT